MPYVDGMPVLQSKLLKLIMKTNEDNALNNEVIMMKEKKENIKDI